MFGESQTERPDKAEPTTSKRRLLRLASLLSLLCWQWTVGPAMGHAQSSPIEPSRDVAFEQKLNAPIPVEARFRDSRGQEVALGACLGEKPAVLLLVYYKCPMLCGLELDALSRTLQELRFGVGKEFNVITVSFDSREGPELAAAKKEKYVKRYARSGAEKGWYFLTGERSSIDRVTNAVGFRYAFDPKRGEYAHAAGVVVVTPQGRVSRYLYGIEFSARDLRLALVEASENRIGSASDQVLLFCYQYDPTRGRYGLAIQNSLRVAGVATAAALAGLIMVLLRREGSVPAEYREPGSTEMQL